MFKTILRLPFTFFVKQVVLLLVKNLGVGTGLGFFKELLILSHSPVSLKKKKEEQKEERKGIW